ncbi:uncharacterized protein LOC122084499 isoform X2 [Macadamia integrifolia]|uniref:uncharacterized protein LOC122084499 isoform X2 n=1 Tax=Macadamia integrifolia TaxID=60698 RepID=UPI001C50083C|nr:uncharacterized protein LOC122084499 isoform X2 [Macadamia integrifolia]
MQFPCLDACKNFASSQSFLGFRNRDHSSFSSSLVVFSDRNPSCGFSCSFNGEKGKAKGGEKPRKNGGRERMNVKEKDNVWSVDNKLAKAAEMAEKDKLSRRRRKGRRVKNFGKRNTSSRVMVSEAMLMEVETVLQTQEPVIKPAWNTFVSSVSGIWKGIGAVFSPITAEMEPVELGNKNEYLYDCYTLSHIEPVQSTSGGHRPQIRRKINWVTLNPHGEIKQQAGGSSRRTEAGRDRDGSSSMKEAVHMSGFNHDLPAFESIDFGTSDVMEEDFMGVEPGLVFFEDGSYSRGPVHVPVGEADDSTYFLSPTFKFEQCLVKGCHKRLRIVHTIEFKNGGSDIQILRVAVYEDQWISPAALDYQSDDPELELKPFSQRKRTQPSDLTGPWKVFEVSATPIFGDDTEIEEGNGVPYVYLCTETLKKRSLPENPVHFGEEEMLDMQDVTVLWLPGGVTGYVDVSKDGILCIGVGWYSEEGINLVMERDYGMDGMLKEVRWKSEVKRRWSDPLPV